MPGGCVDKEVVDSDSNSVFDVNYLKAVPHYKSTSFDKELTADELEQISFHYTQRSSSSIRVSCTALNSSTSSDIVYNETDSSHRELFRVSSSGVLSIKRMENNTWHMIQPELYCMEDVELGGLRGTLVFNCQYSDPSVLKDADRVRALVLAICLVISSIFLLLTFIVYAFVLKQKNVHSWTTMGLTGTMFFMYIFLSISHFITAHEYRAEDGKIAARCKAIGILAHFFFLSMFCWLTAVCFDLWWTFRTITPTNKSATGLGRFCAHAAFAWGVPLLIIIIRLSLIHI